MNDREEFGSQSDGTNFYSYAKNDPINNIDPFGLASLTTDMGTGTTTFDPRPEDANGAPITISTRNAVDSRASSGANAPYSTPDISWVPTGTQSSSYGPDGAYIDTGDSRGRDIHGGGSGLADPLAPNQGWRPTMGCTRGQNADIQRLGRAIDSFKRKHPGVRIPYTRK